MGVMSENKNGHHMPLSQSPNVQNGFKHYVSHPDNSSEIAASSTKVHTRKEVNLLYASSLMTGIMIGSGIFVSPVSVVHHCGSIGLSLVLWLVAGLVTLAEVLCYAEIGTMIPTSGAEVVWFNYVIGRLPAFLFAWMMSIIASPAFFALLGLTTSVYILQPLFPDCPPPTSAVCLIAVWIIVTLAFLNCVYVRYVTRVQTFLAAAKILALIIIIITGIVQIAQGKTEKLRNPFEGTTSDPGAVAIAFYSGVFTYGGWQYLFMLLEEVKDPYKNVPRAAVISFLLVILIYLLTNVAYFTVMSPEEMMASSAVAVTFAERTLGKFSLVVPFFVACSTIGALNGSILGGSRVYFVAARDGLFPSALAMLSVKYLTPITSVWATCLLSVLFVLTGDAITLIEYLGFSASLAANITLLCVIYLKWKEPHRFRPVNIPLVVPVLTAAVLTCLMVLGLYQEPYKNGFGVLLVLAGTPFFCAGVLWERKPKTFNRYVVKCTHVLQKLFLAVPEEREEDNTESPS